MLSVFKRIMDSHLNVSAVKDVEKLESKQNRGEKIHLNTLQDTSMMKII